MYHLSMERRGCNTISCTNIQDEYWMKGSTRDDKVEFLLTALKACKFIKSLENRGSRSDLLRFGNCFKAGLSMAVWNRGGETWLDCVKILVW